MRHAPQKYGADLAYIHDAGFGAFAAAAAGELLHALRERGMTDGQIVDLGCGSGILARALADAGYDVLGYDISAEMVEIARAAHHELNFVTRPVSMRDCRARWP